MTKVKIDSFLNACEELIDCKLLMAEHKISNLLQEIANSSEICSLISECLQEYNRDREFARTYIQDGNGQFVCVMPTEEYKVVALVFCTLADIDNGKIDLTDFIKRFFGREEKPFDAFIKTMIVPFQNLIKEAFGYEEKENQEMIENIEKSFSTFEEENETLEGSDEDKFEISQKIAVQILSELDEYKLTIQIEDVQNVAKSIIKTASLRDETILKALAVSLKVLSKGLKSIKFLVRELIDIAF